jgi:hypothetical protein
MANLLSNTTIGGYQSIHTGNIGSYALTSLPSHNHDDRYFTETESDGRYLRTGTDSEQEVGLRYASWNDGVRRMNTDPRWNESGYDADLGCLHIWSWTAAGVAYGRAGIALFSGSAYQYLTTKSGQTGIFVNNQEIIHSGNIGSQSVSNSNYINSTRDTPGSALQYWQAPGLGIDEAPSGDWHNTIRMGHGSPLSYYSNTLAIRMTGSGVGDIYTQTIMNGNRQGWKKHWNDGNHGSGSGLDADLLDGQQGSYYQPASSAITTSNIGSQSVNFANSSTSAAYLNYTGVGGTQLNANTFSYGRASNYYSTAQILNSPENAYASLYNFGGDTPSALSLQLFASVNHNDTSSTRNLWFRVGNNLGFQNDWKQIIHSGSIGSQSVSYATTAGALSSMNISQFTNNSGYITGYTETDTLATVTARGATTGTLITLTKSDVALKVQEDGTSTAWRGRLGSFNSTADKSSFLGNYTGRPGVFGHNNALTAWAELYVNTLGIYGQGDLYLSWFTYVKGNGNDTNYPILHSGNYNSYAPTLTGGGASGTWGINVTGTAARATRANGNFYIDDNYGNSIVGLYNSTILQGVFAMGDSYKLTAGGGAGNLYGLAWSHPNAGGVASNLNTHGLLVMENGTFLAAISGSIRARDDMRAPIFYDSQDTNYYVDPNGLSRLGTMQIDRIGVGQAVDNGYRIITSGDIYLNANGNGWAEGVWKQRRGGSTYYDVIDSGNIGSQSVNYATTAGSAPNGSNINQFYNVNSGDGNGLRFWGGSDSYKISMGVGALYQYGPVTDYSIKMQMNDSSTDRGFTWGRISYAPIAALNSTSGNMQIAGSFTTTSVNAPSGYVSNGNPWGTANSAYFPNGITTAGSDNWIYGHTYVGNAPSNGSGHEFWDTGKEYHRSNEASSSHGASGRWITRQSANGNYAPYSFESDYGNHSYGVVARYHISNNGGTDRPSIMFSNGYSNTRWNIGNCYYDDQFRITQNMGLAPDGSDGTWGTERLRIDTSGNTYAAIGGTLYANGNAVITSANIGSQSVSYASTAGALSSMNISQFSNNSGYLTGITSGQVTGALGYTPYNSSNPSGYITSGDTVAGLNTTFLGNATSNISSGYTRVIRNENGAGGAPNYAPILHVAASDTMWQIAGAHAGQTTLVWRSGYSGAWNTPWWTIYHSGNFTDNSSNWNTAYGWGNHASAGYLTSLPSHNHDDRYYTETESDGRYIQYGSITSSFGLNDNKLYLRTNGDNNHYIWNAADDWEEIVAYSGTGLRIASSTGVTLATFTTSGNSMNITGNAATATALTSMNISQFTNNSGYITGISFANVSSKPTTISGYGITDAITTSNIGSQSVTNSAQLNGLSKIQLWNNSGQGHSTYQTFGAIPNFGVWFMQNSAAADTPQAGSQYYVQTQGLGNDYAYGTYGLMTAVARDHAVKYTYYRTQEGGSWGSWVKGAAGYADTAGSVAWTNVSSRPTNLSQFTNDLGNYGGFLTSITAHSHAISDVSGLQTALDGKQASGSYLTTSGKAADSELIDGIDSSRIIYGDGSLGSTNYSDMNNTAQKSGFFFYNQPTGNPFGDWTHWINCMGNSWNPNYGFQLAHAFHSNNFAVRVVANGGFSSWRTIIDSGNIGSQSVSYASTAGSATNAGQLNTYGYLVGDNWDTYYTSGKLRVASAAGATGTGRPPSSVHNYGSLLSYGISGEDMFQMYFPDNAGNSIANSRKLHYRTGRGTWCDWRTVVDMVGDTLTIVEGATPKIVVRGSVSYGQPTSASIELVGDADGNQTQSYRWISTAPDWGGQEFRLERKVNNAFQLVGRVPKNTNNLEWQGTIVQGLSDSRVKTNVVSMTEGLDKIDRIRPVTFDWVPTENVSDREGADFGFIAQELEEVLPEVVHTRGDGYKTVMYEKVVPVLVQAMKEQQTMIEALRAEIELLKNK